VTVLPAACVVGVNVIDPAAAEKGTKANISIKKTVAYFTWFCVSFCIYPFFSKVVLLKALKFKTCY